MTDEELGQLKQEYEDRIKQLMEDAVTAQREHEHEISLLNEAAESAKMDAEELLGNTLATTRDSLTKEANKRLTELAAEANAQLQAKQAEIDRLKIDNEHLTKLHNSQNAYVIALESGPKDDIKQALAEYRVAQLQQELSQLQRLGAK